MLNRWIEDELLDTLADWRYRLHRLLGAGPGHAQRQISLAAFPRTPAPPAPGSLSQQLLSEENLARIRGLAAIASRRGQSLAQMAIAWVLRDPRITSALIGARTVEQLDDSLDALKTLDFSADELAEIDAFAADGGIDLWRVSSKLSEGDVV